MKKLKQTKQFKKDLKRYQNYPDKINSLESVLRCLVNETPIPAVHKPHLLKGNYKGYMECHVENDMLLIWNDTATNTIVLVRLGSHSELF